MKNYSYVQNAHPEFIDQMYQQYKQDPNSVEEGWKVFFSGFDYSAGASVADGDFDATKEFGVQSIIHGFRNRGHLLSTTNPIRKRRDRTPHLDLADYSLSDADLHSAFQAGKEIGMSNATLQQIIDRLHQIYCGNIGFEYAHIENREKRMWLRDRIENRPLQDDYGLSLEKKKRILSKLNGAVGFEKFLHTKYIGQKRFSLEGGETAIAALDAIISKAAETGVEETIIGMAHRGRLNVLANIMQKTYEAIFSEFEGNMPEEQSFGDGDVKYHLGFSSQVPTPSGKTMNLKLNPNPSHLEAVNTVVEGYARAKADHLYNSDYDKILPILIHGDAAVAGQGVVYETVQMSQLEGYYTGGTIHFVINNQIGFTTDFDDARSSTYCTGVASLVQAPVFHVNGDDPEAVVMAAELAMEYRQKFNNDVFIDMVCYRKHGHNEGDDPKFTQPEMYEQINKHQDPRELYAAKLIQRGDVQAQMADEMEKEFWKSLQERLDEVKENSLPYQYQKTETAWRSLKKNVTREEFDKTPKTGVAVKQIETIIEHLLNPSKEIKVLSKVNRLLKGGNKLWSDGHLDWAMAELSAYGTLLMEGHDVRMSGQDVKRGTFSHRHAIFRDAKSFEEYNRLSDLAPDQGRFMIYNSLLSEFGVLGFEYGYSLATPNSLVLWEAQFGDFYNGAQVVVDQFVTAGESKWGRMSGLVMLLPHGYEGQGPEHSSGRLERFLQSAGELNISVVNCTTPANHFHALRRQIKWPFRKPMIVMSPKSLLRHPKCISHKSDFGTKLKFQEVLDDPALSSAQKKKARKVILCTGKFYYDLLAHQQDNNIKDVAILRIEQLYPLPEEKLTQFLKGYPKAQVVWAQEEPLNMGAAHYLQARIENIDFEVVARKISASPATGFKKVHEKTQQSLVVKAFA